MQHDGTVIRLRKLDPNYDPHNRVAAMNFLEQRKAAGEVVTGLLYMDTDPEDLHAHMETVATPFNKLGESELCPGATVLDAFNASLR
jgi:2-oxoglutarate/2-oxoacid ferredoxin oxidoreductase subunit beta